jgi:hypothetical protein
MLKCLVLVLDGALQPVLTVQVHDNPALIETVVAFFKAGFHNKTEVSLIRLHLKNRSIVISEMVIRTLPEIRMRQSRNPDDPVPDFAGFRFPCPLK